MVAKSVVTERIMIGGRCGWLIRGYTARYVASLKAGGALWDASQVCWIYYGDDLPDNLFHEVEPKQQPAGEKLMLPVRQVEFLAALAAGKPLVKNAATRLALRRHGLITSDDDWGQIRLTDAGKQWLNPQERPQNARSEAMAMKPPDSAEKPHSNAPGAFGGAPRKVTPLRQQYLDIKAQYPDHILFFRLGDFYETFDQDAEIAARELDLVLTGRPVSRAERVPMAGVPAATVDTYITKLVGKGYLVAVCEQTSEPNGTGLVERRVERVLP